MGIAGLRLREVVVGQLRKKEREIADAPLFAPLLNHLLEERFISHRIHCAVCVAFALIPDDAFNRKPLDGANHSVVEFDRQLVVLGAGQTTQSFTHLHFPGAG